MTFGAPTAVTLLELNYCWGFSAHLSVVSHFGWTTRSKLARSQNVMFHISSLGSRSLLHNKVRHQSVMVIKITCTVSYMFINLICVVVLQGTYVLWIRQWTSTHQDDCWMGPRDKSEVISKLTSVFSCVCFFTISKLSNCLLSLIATMHKLWIQMSVRLLTIKIS